MFGISTVIYKDDLTVLSCSSMDPLVYCYSIVIKYFIFVIQLYDTIDFIIYIFIYFIVYYKINDVTYQNIFFSCIKLWDLRKSYRQITGNKEPLPLAKYFHNMQTRQNVGYIDMIINPQSTRLYASGANNIIHCYSLESLEKSIYFIFIYDL